jgi:CHASE2 domain-containing sensor protein
MRPAHIRALLTIALVGLAIVLAWNGLWSPAAATMFGALMQVLLPVVQWYFRTEQDHNQQDHPSRRQR